MAKKNTNNVELTTNEDVNTVVTGTLVPETSDKAYVPTVDVVDNVIEDEVTSAGKVDTVESVNAVDIRITENTVVDDAPVKAPAAPAKVSDMQIAFTRVRNVKAPKRENSHDAGVDFYIPNYDADFLDAMQNKNKGNNIIVRANGEITIPAHSRVLIPSGIKVWIGNKSSALVAMNKSGVATKTGLIVGACVVDADYTGEVHLSVINTTGNRMYVNCGEKLVQFLHLPVILSDFVEIDNDVYDVTTESSDRGAGGFGSTGMK